LAVLLLLIGFCFTGIDRSPYKEQDYYKNTITALGKIKPDTGSDKCCFFKAGWSFANITPDHAIVLAGYSPWRNNHTKVRDSIYVKAFCFSEGNRKVALLTVDLLIFPPLLKDSLLQRLKTKGYTEDNLYLSATHTHHGPGGWAGHPAGKVIAGGVDEQYFHFLIEQLSSVVLAAESDLKPAELGMGKAYAPALVINRIKPEDSIDPWIRYLRIRQVSGKESALVTFAAHNNCLDSKHEFISCDYAGVLTHALEERGGLDMAAYCAGAVGSMKPANASGQLTDLLQMDFIGNKIAQLTLSSSDSLSMSSNITLSSFYLPVELRAPHLKITEDIRVRPFVFNWAFGPYQAGIRVLKVGSVLMLGMPCDFSGQLMAELEQYAAERGMQLIVTSFNGAYIGYVTNDAYYDLDKSESRTMNWFGPENGAYFSELAKGIIDKYGDEKIR